MRGKREKRDVQEFQHRLMDNILDLHRELAAGTYKHGPYHAFKISDPKPRDIHKATVRDRLVHHAIYRQLYPFFNRTFIADSYSCRRGKGTHRAMNRLRQFAYKVSKNHTRTAWVLKCDIKKFFASTDQQILLNIVATYIPDKQIVDLIAEVVGSFPSFPRMTLADAAASASVIHKGLPLGNLTSQLLVNVYMNEFDQFVKHKLKTKYYIRYADDFAILESSRRRPDDLLPLIEDFLRMRLNLILHPDKVSISTLASGVDFLGWVHFTDHRVLRTNTKRRMLKRVVGLEAESPTVQSYLGMLGHGNTGKLQAIILNNG
ncbi:MAG TPA: reverse transcriptase/maturase family protein [Candidatus Paceibacterota bacterium]